jgi:uncharacterized membrane protein
MVSGKASKRSLSDERIEGFISNILLFGVVLAALTVALGGTLYLVRHGSESSDYHRFLNESRNITGIIHDVLAFKARGIIQLGLLILVATPIARVAFSLIAFARQRDGKYVVITSIVLLILFYGLLGG